jgi:hypothetical protein
MSTLAKTILFVVAFAAALVAIAFGLRRVRRTNDPARPGPWGALRKAFWVATGTLLGTTAGCVDDVDGPYVSCYAARFDGDGTQVDADDHAENGASEADDQAEDGPSDDAFWVGCYAPLDVPDDAFGPPESDADAHDEAVEEADAEAEAVGDGDDQTEDGPSDDVFRVECYAPIDVLDVDFHVTPEEDVPSDSGDAGPDGGAHEPQAGLAPTDSRQQRRARRLRFRARAMADLLADPSTHPAVRRSLLRDLAALRRKLARIDRSRGTA